MLNLEARKHAVVEVGNNWNDLIEQLGNKPVEMIEGVKLLTDEVMLAIDAADKDELDTYKTKCKKIAALALHLSCVTTENKDEEESEEEGQ